VCAFFSDTENKSQFCVRPPDVLECHKTLSRTNRSNERSNERSIKQRTIQRSPRSCSLACSIYAVRFPLALLFVLLVVGMVDNSRRGQRLAQQGQRSGEGRSNTRRELAGGRGGKCPRRPPKELRIYPRGVAMVRKSHEHGPPYINLGREILIERGGKSVRQC